MEKGKCSDMVYDVEDCSCDLLFLLCLTLVPSFYDTLPVRCPTNIESKILTRSIRLEFVCLDRCRSTGQDVDAIGTLYISLSSPSIRSLGS